MTGGLPDKTEHRAAWAALSMADRRRIMRTVTRGVAADNRRDARLAIGAAEQQKFFWKWAWGLGPMLGLILIGRPWIQIVLNVVMSTALIVALSRWRWVRADRSQRANLELLEGPRKKARAGKAKEGHLPGEVSKPARGARRGPAPRPAEWSGEGPDPNTSRAKLKRRKKRR